MHPTLHIRLAEARIDDLRRSAAEHRALPPGQGHTVATGHAVTLRLALASEEHEIARLAALDSARTPAWPVLLALVNQEARAAISLTDGTVVADPFEPTAELVELLHARSRQLAAGGEVTWPRRLRLAGRRRPPLARASMTPFAAYPQQLKAP
jgi:hypothetical protein